MTDARLEDFQSTVSAGVKAAGVYRITRLQTGKCYIGASSDVHRRLSSHRAALKKGCHTRAEMQKDFHHDGESGFSFVVVGIYDSLEEAYGSEARLISESVRDGKAYNAVVPIDIRVPKRNGQRSRGKKALTSTNAEAWTRCEAMLDWKTERDFVALLEQFLKASEMSAAKLGKLLINDHRFIGRLRQGFSCTLRVAERADKLIVEAIEDYKISIARRTAA